MSAEFEASLQKQLEEVRVDIRQLSTDIVKLTTINEHQYEERQSNSARLQRLDNEFSNAKGAIMFLKGLISLFGASAIAFFTWIVISNNELQREYYLLNQKITLLETKVKELEEDKKYAYIKPQ